MTAVSVIGPGGDTGSKTVELPDEIFAAKVNVPLIHQVVVAQQAAARQGTHATTTWCISGTFTFAAKIASGSSTVPACSSVGETMFTVVIGSPLVPRSAP